MLDVATGSSMSNVTLSSHVLSPTGSGGLGASVVQVLIQTSNGPVTLDWDGTTDAGAALSAGVYQVEVHWSDGKGGTADITRGLVITPGGSTDIVVARHNILKPTESVTFDVGGVSGATGMRVTVYSLAGELVRTPVTGSATTLAWPATDLASGVYIAVIEVLNAQGGTIKVQRTKILVVH
jgi:flagellar hook assembly protein FlgD